MNVKVRVEDTDGNLLREEIVSYDQLNILFAPGLDGSGMPRYIFGYPVLSIIRHSWPDDSFVFSVQDIAPDDFTHLHVKPSNIFEWNATDYEVSSTATPSYVKCKKLSCGPPSVQKKFNSVYAMMAYPGRSVSKERMADILEAAADALLVDGWCQGALHRDENDDSVDRVKNSDGKTVYISPL